MAHRYITPHYAPANNTLALMVRRESDDLVAPYTSEQDVIIPAADFSIIGNDYTPYRPQNVRVPAGRAIWFVQSGHPGLSYIVVQKSEGFACSCKDARNGHPCEHTGDVASFEACCRETEEEQIARIAEEVGVPVGQVALIAALAKSFRNEPEPVNPVEEARAFIAWVRKDKAQKAECAA